MFCDQAEIKVKAGKGGDGLVGWRREKYCPYGGPDGGDGGGGGNVILRVNCNLNTLSDFRRAKLFKAEDGENGAGNNMHGKSAEDLILEVPEGTQVTSLVSKKNICDLTTDGQEFILARGGRGGFGNAHFTSSTRQAPDFAELGEPGEELEVRLDLKLVAQVGIIGFPSVGKSTLISRISNAKPKIADYPFTTLIPNLGMVKVGSKDFVVADVPGLIEGASEGKGLGHEFLRHVERTLILIHMLDPLRDDIVKDFEVINNELKKFDSSLVRKPQIIVINKIDALDQELQEMLVKDFKKRMHTRKKVFVISAVSGKGLDELLYEIKNRLEDYESKAKPIKQDVPKDKIFRPHLKDMDQRFFIDKKRRKFTVHGKRLEQIAVMTDMSNPSAMDRLRDVMKKKGVFKELSRMGAKDGDKIEIGPVVISYDQILFR
ncbi:MAG: GTPase ObgE [Candidatus Gracilibacteria bacterium]|nr:GTPase ObgE [Candidatus Gracilibacteria bacterium]